jgi:hypothetical protein
VLSNRSFTGRGTQWYLLLRFKLNKLFEISVKLASTYFDLIEGNIKNIPAVNRYLGVQFELKN